MQPTKVTKIKLTRYVLWVIAILIGLSLGMVIVWKFAFRAQAMGEMSAVFLTNEQVYFGEIVKQNKETITLENVYYLKANAALPESNSQQPTAQLSLIKLGDELHSPEDKMVINKQHVLFYESMRGSGTIMDAIAKHEQKKN